MLAVLPARLVLTMDDFRGIAEVGYRLPLAFTLCDWVKALCDLAADLMRRFTCVPKINRFQWPETNVAPLAAAQRSKNPVSTAARLHHQEQAVAI